MRDPVRVFVHVRHVSRRADPYKHRYAVELIARGTGTIMYRSKTCETEPLARNLATSYLAKHADRLIEHKVATCKNCGRDYQVEATSGIRLCRACSQPVDARGDDK